MPLRALLLIVLTCSLGACERSAPPDTTPAATAAERPATQAGTAAGRTDAEAEGTDCTLVLGWDPWEPYHYRDVGGEIHGLDVELITAMANEAGCRVEFDQEDWATLLERLRRGQIDLLAGATRTEAREAFAWFSQPYRPERFRLYVRAGEQDKYAAPNLEALLGRGIRIGVTEEYIYSPEVERLAADPRYRDQFEGVSVGEVNYDKLLNLRIDGFLEDVFVAATVLRKKGLDDQIEAHPLDFGGGEVHLMFSRASVDRDVVDRLDQALARLRDDGRYQRILDRYR